MERTNINHSGIGTEQMIDREEQAATLLGPMTITTTPVAITAKEQKKFLFYKGIFRIIYWHLSTIIACSASAVLFYLNFSEYAIGTEVGKDRRETANVLGALQLTAKIHEIVMIASLIRIAQQYAQRCLIGDGTLLGLVGAAETSLSSVGFLVSRELWVALRHTYTLLWNKTTTNGERRGGRRLLIFIGFSSISCIVGALAGPASAVLMIPRYEWFFETDVVGRVPGMRGMRGTGGTRRFPSILIDPLLASGNLLPRTNIFAAQTDYWNGMLSSNARYNKAYPGEMSYSHRYLDHGVNLVVNSTSRWNRPLTTNADWKGHTTLTSVMAYDIDFQNSRLFNYSVSPKYNNSDSAFVARMTGIEAEIVCQRRKKLPCPDGVSGLNSNSSSTNSSRPNWCYLDVTADSSEGSKKNNADAIWVLDNAGTPGLWMTEGPRVANGRFSESLVLIFEANDGGSGYLLVCTFSATLKAATVTSTAPIFSPDQARYQENQPYFKENKTIPGLPRKLLFHENWLDSINRKIACVDECENCSWNAPSPYANTSYTSRPQLLPTENKSLKEWATTMISTYGVDGYVFDFDPSEKDKEAALAEVTAGGSFLSSLIWMFPSSSQYVGRSQYVDGSLIVLPIYPPDLIPEPIVDCTTFSLPPVKIYRRVYGFRLSSRTGILGVVVLATHALLALLGSIWQLYHGNIIQAWVSIPEYISLALGSNLSREEVENTCAGIRDSKTLGKVLRVRDVDGEHLELVVGPLPENAGPVERGKMY